MQIMTVLKLVAERGPTKRPRTFRLFRPGTLAMALPGPAVPPSATSPHGAGARASEEARAVVAMWGLWDLSIRLVLADVLARAVPEILRPVGPSSEEQNWVFCVP